MRILLLTHYFPPEISAAASRILETAQDLRDRGHDVHVVAPFPSYPLGSIPAEYRGKLISAEDVDGVPVVRTWLLAVPNRGLHRRSLSHLTFATTALLTALKTPARPDVILVDMHPLPLCFTAWLLSRIWRRPYVLNVCDLIPDQAVAYGVLSNPMAIAISRRLADGVCHGAAQLVAFSRGFEQALLSRGADPGRVSLIYYGADVDALRGAVASDQGRLDEAAERRFVVLYVGNHGAAYGLEALLSAADLLRHDAAVEFWLVGEGSEKSKLIQRATAMKLESVKFLDPIPRGSLAELYKSVDVCAATLRRLDFVKTMALSCKIFEYMAAGRPVLVAAEGETADLVERADGGLVVEPENPEQLAAAVQRLRASPALRRRLAGQGRDYVERHFSRRVRSDRLAEVLATAAGRSAQIEASAPDLP
ncbi:MAG: glycosyltransferase family 4 protein [Candidatus Dormibacteraeota bacterium]|nr:glycosyltransferase family 4 protein [Candidatus Dormibacteraeota bacterium]